MRAPVTPRRVLINVKMQYIKKLTKILELESSYKTQECTQKEKKQLKGIKKKQKGLLPDSILKLLKKFNTDFLQFYLFLIYTKFCNLNLSEGSEKL